MKGPVECQPSPNRDQKVSTSGKLDDEEFSEYMWMADELEEFDRKVEMEFWEEVFIEACFEEMWEEEDEEWFYPDDVEKQEHIHEFYQNAINEAASKLNPDAQEFYPESYMLDEVYDDVIQLR